MENKIKPKLGDVWWNAKEGYGKMYVGNAAESTVYDSVMFSNTGMWPSYSPCTTLRVSDEFVLLFNMHNLIKDCNNEHST